MKYQENNALTLRAENLTKSYKKRQVVGGVSFEVKQGEVVGLLGPNGAGKTTSFYMMVGLVRPDSGQIFLEQPNFAQNLTKLPIHQRAHLGMGYLPQEPSIFRKLTVEENLRAVLETQFDRTEVKRRTNFLLEEMRIDHIRHTLGMSVSGGERRRVEIARALALEPHFILLDEPFAGVDPISVGDIQNIIRHLLDRGLGVLITDHDVRATLSICQRAYVMSSGKVIAEGNAQTISQHPEVRRVYLGNGFTF